MKFLGTLLKRYDIPVLKGALFDEFFARDPEFSCIMRGSGVMQFQYKRIISRDVGWLQKCKFIISKFIYIN